MVVLKRVRWLLGCVCLFLFGRNPLVTGAVPAPAAPTAPARPWPLVPSTARDRPARRRREGVPPSGCGEREMARRRRQMASGMLHP